MVGKLWKYEILGLIQSSNQQLEWLANAPPSFCFQMDRNIKKNNFSHKLFGISGPGQPPEVLCYKTKGLEWEEEYRKCKVRGGGKKKK